MFLRRECIHDRFGIHAIGELVVPPQTTQIVLIEWETQSCSNARLGKSSSGLFAKREDDPSAAGQALAPVGEAI